MQSIQRFKALFFVVVDFFGHLYKQKGQAIQQHIRQGELQHLTLYILYAWQQLRQLNDFLCF